MTKRLLLVSLSVAWVAALFCVTEVLAAGTCDPDCSADPLVPVVEDPLNCTQFYLCLAPNVPSDSPGSCPDNTSFKPDDQKCTGSLPCKPTCTLPDCKLACTDDLDKIFDQKSCSSYYVCLGNNLLGPLECPDNQPYFDGVAMACSTDETKCCGDPCIAYCYAPGMEVSDPYDCTKYYLCIEEGLPDELNHKTCTSGSNFDVVLGHCVAGAPCNKLCDDTTVPGGGTTPSSGCQESMTCTSVGLFAKCMTCDQQYFNCLNVGQPATVETCTGSLLFNTDPAFPYCVQPSDCPHHPAL